MLSKDQIKLVQTAVRAAGIRTTQFDGRYRMLLANYKRPNGCPAASCKQLNNSQLEDLLAICESHGWRMPGQSEDFYRKKVAASADFASFAMQSAIKHLANDLGWNNWQLGGLLERMTDGKVVAVEYLTPKEAYKIIECLKAMFNRKNGTNCNTVQQIKEANQSRNSDKPAAAESGTFALSGLRESPSDSAEKRNHNEGDRKVARDGSNQDR